jgi:hypothetical protein
VALAIDIEDSVSIAFAKIAFTGQKQKNRHRKFLLPVSPFAP